MAAPPFFDTLGALAARQQENQLSRTFKAVFDNSAEFRSRFGKLLVDRTDIELPNTDWNCRTEESLEHGAGRLDLHLRHADGTPVVAIESKVEAPLHEEQLARYVRGGVRPLVILTKYPAEVSKRVLRKWRIVSLRWQDVHDLVCNPPPSRPVDRFLFRTFADYLENAGMSYPQRITSKDVRYMAELLRAIRQDVPAGRVSPRGFETASACQELLGALAKDLRDAYPPLARASQWGPGYFNCWDKGEFFHALSVVLYKKPWRDDRGFYASVYVPNSPRAEVTWCIEYLTGTGQPKFREEKLNKYCSRDGRLGPDRLREDLIVHARKWRVRV